ncbi:hypothetical protein K1719_007390 [Acacia pycnantha]|nr:hypothetical protein K1719_007390 [Acacia pycnantha]
MDCVAGGRSKPHALLTPFPSQGHINAGLQLAKLLHLRGFFITFVNTESNHKCFLRSRDVETIQGLPEFRSKPSQIMVFLQHLLMNRGVTSAITILIIMAGFRREKQPSFSLEFIIMFRENRTRGARGEDGRNFVAISALFIFFRSNLHRREVAALFTLLLH